MSILVQILFQGGECQDCLVLTSEVDRSFTINFSRKTVPGMSQPSAIVLHAHPIPGAFDLSTLSHLDFLE